MIPGTAMELELFDTDLQEIRSLLAREGSQSWTSDEYQNDVYRFIMENREHGEGIIEVGCYKGGLSVFLAFACRKSGWPFYTIDISHEFVETTRNLLTKLGLAQNAHFFVGTLQEFAAQIKLKKAPLLTVIDGDHQYTGVLNDIKSLYRLNCQSYAAAFHDFSLRHDAMPDERVDRAIFEFFGADAPLTRIGAQFDENTSYPLRTRPSDDGHYWELNGSEGVIIRLPSHPNVMQSPDKRKTGIWDLLNRYIIRKRQDK